MKTSIRNLFVVPALTAGLGLVLAGRVTAQTFTTLYSFTASPSPYYTNSGGANPSGGLILSVSTLYGTPGGGNSLSASVSVDKQTRFYGFYDWAPRLLLGEAANKIFWNRLPVASQ